MRWFEFVKNDESSSEGYPLNERRIEQTRRRISTKRRLNDIAMLFVVLGYTAMGVELRVCLSSWSNAVEICHASSSGSAIIFEFGKNDAHFKRVALNKKRENPNRI